MSIAEYTAAVEQLERGEIPAALAEAGYSPREAALFLAREILAIAWQPGFREEALALAVRLESI